MPTVVKTLGQGLEGKQPESLVDVDLIDVPNTEIDGRAKILDLAALPQPMLGIERISGLGVDANHPLLSNEVGPAGEPVYGSADPLDRIRIYGFDWTFDVASTGGSNGTRVRSDVGNNYIEVVFYGTGINMLTRPGSEDIRVTIDGGAESATLVPASISGVLQGRNYSTHQVTNAASGLSLGIHHARFRVVANQVTIFYGFEILNESTGIDIPAGTIHHRNDTLNVPATTAESFNSGFDADSDAVGTKGGHVVVYAEKDSTGTTVVKKRFNATDTQNDFTGTVDHSNEQLIRKIHWQEFGAGRADDFSTLGGTASDRAFTLDDGTTALVGGDVSQLTASNTLRADANNDSWTLTFIGTGLDLELFDDAAGGSDTYDIDIDGSAIGTLPTAGTNSTYIQPIISGLPYGTHTVKFERISAATFNRGVHNFLIYGPKKPEIPEDAVELSSYYLMADFAAGTAGLDTIATGTLRKSCTRELSYIDGTDAWSSALALNVNENVGGWFADTDGTSNTGSKMDVTFFGTGLELRFRAATNQSTTITTSIASHTYGDGTFATWSTATGGGGMDAGTLTAVSTSRTNSTVYGGPTNSSGTGEFSMNAATQFGAGFSASGLPLGLWTVRFTQSQASTNRMRINTVDVITPIHVPYATRNIANDFLPVVGSNSMRSEMPLPNHKTEKQFFPAGVDLGPNKTKWQTKFLLADVSTDIEMTDLTFKNLKIGKTYRYHANLNASVTGASDTVVQVKAKDGATEIAEYSFTEDSGNAGSVGIQTEFTRVFTATSTKLSFETSSASANALIKGDSGQPQRETYVTLEELPNHIETNEWD